MYENNEPATLDSEKKGSMHKTPKGFFILIAIFALMYAIVVATQLFGSKDTLPSEQEERTSQGENSEEISGFGVGQARSQNSESTERWKLSGFIFQLDFTQTLIKLVVLQQPTYSVEFNSATTVTQNGVPTDLSKLGVNSAVVVIARERKNGDPYSLVAEHIDVMGE